MATDIQILTAGQDATLVIKLLKDGETYPEADLTDANAVAFIRKLDTFGTAEISDHAVTVDAAEATGTIELSDTETALLPPTNVGDIAPCAGEIKITEADGDIYFVGPFSFDVRRPIELGQGSDNGGGGGGGGGGGEADGVINTLVLSVANGQLTATAGRTIGNDVVSNAVTLPTGGNGASSFADLTGQIADSQIPDTIMRDAELTASAVRMLLDLTADEVDELLTDAEITGNTLTITHNDGTTTSLSLPAAGESVSDGVVTGGSVNDAADTLTLTRSEGDDVTVSLPALLRNAQRVIDYADNATPPTNGRLEVATGDNHARIVEVYNVPGTDATGTLSDFSHSNYEGVYPSDQAANNAIIGNNQFYFNSTDYHFRQKIALGFGQTTFSNYNITDSLPSGANYRGRWGSDQEGLNHLEHTSDLFFNTDTRKVRQVGSDFVAHGDSQTQRSYKRLAEAGDITGAVETHDEATDAHDDIRTEINTDVEAHDTSGTAHNSIRSLISDNEDRLDALDAVEIAAYDSAATYSRGSANSIVTHSNGLFIYISSTSRSSGHDPDTQPGYWLELSEGVAYEVITTGSHRIAARTLVVDGVTDQVYLCTTTQTTPRDLDYIEAQAASIGGTFINLTNLIPTTWKGPHVIGQDYDAGDRVTTNANTRIYTARVDTGETPPHADWIQVGPVGSGGGTTVEANPSGTDGDNLERIAIDGTNYNVASGDAVGVVKTTLLSGTFAASDTEDGTEFTLDHNVTDFSDGWLEIVVSGFIPAYARYDLLLASRATQQADAPVAADIPDAAVELALGRESSDIGGTGATSLYIYRSDEANKVWISIPGNRHLSDTFTLGHISDGGGSDLAVQEEGTEVAAAATTLNFTGAGATATASDGAVTVDIPGGQAGSLDDGSVTTAKLADGAVTTPKLADDAVTGAKIADDTIHGGSLVDGTIATIKIGDDQVTGAKLSDNAVSSGKVADDAITEAKLADNAVTTDKIAAGAVGSSDLGSFVVIASKLNSNAVTTNKIADDAVTTAKLADNAAGEGKVPIDDTMQFDGSGDLGVQITTVTELLSEDIRYYSSDTTREDAHQASKGVVFMDTSRFAKKIHSVEWDFEGDGIGNNYATFLVGIDSSDDITHIYGQSDVLFNVTTSGTHRFTFGTEGLRVLGSVERLGLFLTRTGSPADANHETKLYRGQPADDSPRESYPSASLDFPFWRSARFNSARPEIGEHIDNYITNGEIYGYPKIRYTIEVEHTPFVGDGSVSVSHISSGSSADGTVLTADGSGGAAFEAGGLSESEVDARVTAGVLDFAETGNTDDVPVGKIPGGITHIESGATYNNNVITVSTAETVRGGDGILFFVPSPFGTSATQEVSLAIDGQANSEHPLHDRNGDVLHEADLTVNSVYIAISDASSWDILVLPSGDGAAVADNRLIPDGGTDGQVLTKASGTDYDADWEDAAAGGGGGTGVSIGDSIGTYRLVNSYTTNRMYASTVPTPVAADGDLLVITFEPDATSPDNAMGGSEIAFVPLDNLLAIPNAYTGSSSADTEGSNRDALRTGFGQNDWLYLGGTVAGAGNITIGSTDAKYAGVFTFRLLTYGVASESGQESPGSDGVVELTASLVEITLWKWVLTTDGKPANPAAHWRFDDEWDGTTPQSADGGGWYINRANALDEADNNPAFSEDTWTLWIASEQVRRRVVNDAYSYVDGGYTVTAVWDIQYSTDAMTWTVTQPDLFNYIRYRDLDTGEWGPLIPTRTNDWIAIRTNDLVYPAASNVDELQAAYDFGNFAELLFIVAGYRSVQVDDGMGGTMAAGVNGPWHHFVVNRGGGWPVADASESEDNNDASDGDSFQFSYSTAPVGGGLLIWERGDDYVDPGNPPFLQDDGEPPTQLGGHFKIVSTDGDEAHVTKFRFFAFSHAFARTTMSIFARYR